MAVPTSSIICLPWLGLLLLLLLLLQVCRIHCATSNPTSVVLGKTSDEAVVRGAAQHAVHAQLQQLRTLCVLVGLQLYAQGPRNLQDVAPIPPCLLMLCFWLEHACQHWF
jgi:hypothetical protein